MTGRQPHPGDPWHPDWTATGDQDDAAEQPADSSVDDFDNLRPPDAPAETAATGEEEETGELPVVATDDEPHPEASPAADDPVGETPDGAAPEPDLEAEPHSDVSAPTLLPAEEEQLEDTEAEPVPDEGELADHEGRAQAEAGDEEDEAPVVATGEESPAGPDEAPTEESELAGGAELDVGATADEPPRRGLFRRRKPRPAAQPVPEESGEDAEPDDVMWDEMAAALIQTPDQEWDEDWPEEADGTEDEPQFESQPTTVAEDHEALSEDAPDAGTAVATPREEDGEVPLPAPVAAAEAEEDEAEGDGPEAETVTEHVETEAVFSDPAAVVEDDEIAGDAGAAAEAPEEAETAGSGDEAAEDAVTTGPLVMAVPDEPDTDEVPVVGPAAAPTSATPPGAEVEDEPVTDEVPLPHGFGGIDELTEEAFVALSTMEHRGLAEVIEDDDGTAVQALAAPMAGLDTGLLGFEDVVGVPDAEAEQLRSRPRRTGSNLALRAATGLALGAIVVGAVWAGDAAIAGLATAVFLLALGEFYAVLVKAGYRPISLFGLLGGAGTLLGARVWGPVAVPGALLVTAIIIYFFFSIVPGRRDPLVNGALTLAGVAWVAGLGSFVMPLLDGADFRLLVFSIVAVTVFMDVAQYFAGRSWGYRRIAPVLSPNKTVAGLVGGAVIALGMGFALGNVEPLDTKTGLILAGAVIAAAPLGDLAVSSLKRAIGIKDMSGILPGHGGVLDRVDALLFTFPAGWLVFRWLGYLT